jgi:hypothetical protein
VAGPLEIRGGTVPCTSREERRHVLAAPVPRSSIQAWLPTGSQPRRGRASTIAARSDNVAGCPVPEWDPERNGLSLTLFAEDHGARSGLALGFKALVLGLRASRAG